MQLNESFNIKPFKPTNQQTETEYQKKTLEIKPLGDLERIQILFSKDEHLPLLYSIGKCWVKAQLMMIEGGLVGDKELIQKAQIKLAKGVDHRFYEIGKSFTEIVYGENNVLVSSRNIATKQALHDEADKKAYIDLRHNLSQKIKENDLILISWI